MANAIDVLTLTEAKLALNITGTTSDTELPAWITAVSQQLDKVCGPIVTRTVSSESHDGGVPTLYLKNRPVSSVSAVVEYSGTTGTVLTAESPGTAGTYLIEAAAGVLRRRSGLTDACFAAGRRNVVVTYVAGRFDSSSVDEKFKTAARVTLANLWRREQGGGSETFGGLESLGVVPGFGLPNAVLDILKGEILAPESG